jgi:hypothetical protein
MPLYAPGSHEDEVVANTQTTIFSMLIQKDFRRFDDPLSLLGAKGDFEL